MRTLSGPARSPPMEYSVNTQEREDGTVVLHAERCQYLPHEDHREAVGSHEDCRAALEAARRRRDRVHPCRTCCSDCA